MTSIPIYLVTGYLGSGKTTLVNHLLRLPQLRALRVALLINEFGSLGVDGQLLQHDADRIFELNRGSLFCACLQGDFEKTLRRIGEEVEPDLLIAEATGVAQTGDLYKWIETASVAPRFEVRANLCVIDCLHFTKVLPYLNAASAQAIAADGLVLNKTDLVPPEHLPQLSAILRQMNPRALQIEVAQGAIPWEFVAGLRHQPCQAPPATAPPSELATCSIAATRADRTRFIAAVEGLKGKLLRLKGVIDFGAGPVLVEAVFDTFTESPPPPTAAPRGITVIGWNTTADTLHDAFAGPLGLPPSSGQTLVSIDGA